jgi:hypothetical protein
MLCNGFTKLSLLSFYLQLSPDKWFRMLVWATIAIVGCLTTVITALLFFHCNPIAKSWDPTIEEGQCFDVGILYMATAVSNIITDVLIFFLPLPTIIGLQMKRAQKASAVAVFAVGSAYVLPYISYQLRNE